MTAPITQPVLPASDRLPSPEQEVWRYSRIAELDLAAFSPGSVRTSVSGMDGLPSPDAALVADVVAAITVHDVFD